ncbi:DDE superfamily endonuclease [Popillia japonica]|uniref:DDE superfamily endonuclease n=1 Tax=Popillia japonica TaxID=7064 RepID=A0AAW1JD06_POPJA
MGFNKVQFRKFHDNLKKILSSSDIFNIDETGISTVPNKQQAKVICPRRKRLVSKVVSQERGQTVTAVCSVSAAGYYVPPALIFPRYRYKPEFDTLGMVSDSGCITRDLFLTWLHHFTKHVMPFQEKKKLLLDNHISHCSLVANDYCRESGIILLSLPPHASHKLQPLDVTVEEIFI